MHPLELYLLHWEKEKSQNYAFNYIVDYDSLFVLKKFKSSRLLQRHPFQRVEIIPDVNDWCVDWKHPAEYNYAYILWKWLSRWKWQPHTLQKLHNVNVIAALSAVAFGGTLMSAVKKFVNSLIQSDFIIHDTWMLLLRTFKQLKQCNAQKIIIAMECK